MSYNKLIVHAEQRKEVNLEIYFFSLHTYMDMGYIPLAKSRQDTNIQFFVILKYAINFDKLHICVPFTFSEKIII